MRAARMTVFLLLIWQACFSQWNDDYSDGDFLTNPPWVGDVTNFIIENNVLRLNAPAEAKKSYLSTHSDNINDASWQFSVRMDFNPSSSNYSKVYLVADNEDLAGPINGYFVKLGNTEDEVSLYRQDGLEESEIINGTDSRLSLSNVEVVVLVTRTVNGEWNLSSKLAEETDWITEGSVIDNMYNTSSFFGVTCTYTSTRSTKFYFDDFSVTGTPFIDTDPPMIDTIYTNTNKNVVIRFNEPIRADGDPSDSSYLLNGEVVPTQIFLMDSSIELTFEKLEVINSIKVSGIIDLFGNEMIESQWQFVYVEESPVIKGDIIINEIMADPSPLVDLPDAEYLELLNTTTRAINMTNWSCSDKRTETNLDSYIILPDSILILCKYSNIDLLEPFGNVMGLSPWPSLNNGGDSIILRNSLGETIDVVEYNRSWYNDIQKEEGGWSLERSVTNARCYGPHHWQASKDKQGGTPGRANSVIVQDPDGEIITDFVVSEDTIIIYFKNSILGSIPLIHLEEASIQQTYFSNWYQNELTIISSPLQVRTEYTLEIEGLEDCAGKSHEKISLYFVIPEQAEFGDLVISEVLFNPSGDGVDFVEVYNKSPKYIFLTNWDIGSEETTKVLSDSEMIKPYEYRCFSSEPKIIMRDYPNADEGNIYAQVLPALYNDYGRVVLSDAEGTTIDSITYDENWHFSYLKNVEGVSLERINFDRPGYLSSNWASGASTENYATPGYRNSQQSERNADGAINISPRVIIPDANGVDDFATISMSDNLAGSLVTITIYNIHGVPIKKVANNSLVGSNTVFTWDGTDKNGGLVPLGHYIVMIESITNNAQTNRIREKIVVARGF